MANDYRTLDAINGGSADISKNFAAGFAAPVDLRTISGYPNYCPQRVYVTSTAAGAFVYKDRNGNTNTMQIGASGPFQVDLSLSTLEAGSNAAVSVVAVWWIDASTRFNP